MKKLILACFLLSLGLACFLVGCSCGGPSSNVKPIYSAIITVNEDNNGNGVANVSVFCDGNKVGETDSNGKYTISNLRGEHEIKVSANGYLFENNTTSVSESSKEVTFKAIKSFKISGIVKSADILIEGAKVKTAGDYPVESLTDADGKFEINTAGNVTEIAAEYQGVAFEKNTQGYNKTTQNDNIVFDGFYSKTIVVRSGNIRINDAEVQVTDKTGKSDTKSSGSNGEYIFNGLYGSLTVNVVHSNYDNSEPIVSNVLNGSIQISKTFTLKGSIAGVDLEGIIVSATGGKTTSTDENGEFALGGLSGNVALNVSKKNYTYIYTDDSTAINSKIYSCSANGISIKMESFLVSGAITSGTIKVYDALVKSDKQFGSDIIKTDGSGSFSIWITEPGEIEFEKGNYTINNYAVSKTKTGIEISATYSVYGQVYETEDSNKIGLEGVLIEITDELSYSQSFTTLDDGMFSFNGLTGEATISASRVDKTFNNASRKVTAQSSPINFSTTSYSIEGYVKTGEIAVAQAQVKTQSGEVCITNINGYYKFDALEGENVLTVVKDGYSFNDITINFDDEGSQINFDGTFKISGTIKSGTLFVSGAKVEIQGTSSSVITDSLGRYEFTGLNSEVNLLVTKADYTFIGTTNFTGANLNANFDSEYKVKIKVELIDAALKGVKIYCGADYLGETNNNGECEISLNGEKLITFLKEGYEFSSHTFTEPEILTVKAVFIVTILIDLNGTLITNNIEVINEGQAATVDGDRYLIKSNAKIKIEVKSDAYEIICSEVQNPFEALDSIEVKMYAFQYYNISGKVQTYSGADTSNVSDYSGDLILKSSYQINGETQPVYERNVAVNGSYTVKSFGNTSIIAENYLINPNKLYLVEDEKTVGEEASEVNFTLIAVKEFALHLYNEAEKLSNEAAGRYVTVSGTAMPKGQSAQNIFGFRTRDEFGNIKNLSGNYGPTTLGVNPSVACLTYVPTPVGGVLSDNLRTFITKGTNVKSDYTIETVPNAENVSRSTYLSNRMGYAPESITPYNISYNTIKTVTVKFENSDWIVDFDFNVGTSGNSAVIQYTQQIKYFLPTGNFNSWQSAKLKMTLNNEGYIKTLAYDEAYTIRVVIVNIETKVTAVETYHIQDGTAKIPINLSRNGVNITDGNGTIISH